MTLKIVNDQSLKRNQIFFQILLEIYYPSFIGHLEDITLKVYFTKLCLQKSAWKIEVASLFVPLKSTHFTTLVKRGNKRNTRGLCQMTKKTAGSVMTAKCKRYLLQELDQIKSSVIFLTQEEPWRETGY